MKITNKDEIGSTIRQLSAQLASLEQDVSFNRNWLKALEKSQGVAEAAYTSHEAKMKAFLSKRASALVLASGHGLVQTEASAAAHNLLSDVAERLEKIEADLWCQVATARQLVEATREHIEKAVKQVELTKREIAALTCVLETVDEEYCPPSDV